jgi:large subunit ribosomal protein L17
MIHLRAGRKLKRTSSHKKALMRNMATSLFEHKKITTTLAKAKELRPYAESLITKAKHALQNEKQGVLPEGQTVDIHNRRVVYRHIQKKAVLQELFDTIAPMVETRPGGYTRIIKTGFRRGDSGASAIIELVDWSAPQDGTVSMKQRSQRRQRSKQPKGITAPTVKHDELAAIVEADTVNRDIQEIEKTEQNIMESEVIDTPDTNETFEETIVSNIVIEEAIPEVSAIEEVIVDIPVPEIVNEVVINEEPVVVSVIEPIVEEIPLETPISEPIPEEVKNDEGINPDDEAEDSKKEN